MENTINDLFVINPAYFLKNDSNKIIFCARDNYKEPGVSYESFFTYLHPYNAQLLSFFDGENTLGEALEKASAHFKLSRDELYEIVKQLIENPEGKSIRHQWHWMYFPAHVLLNKKKVTSYTSYPLDSFLSYGDLDLGDFRLNTPLSANLLLTMKCYTNCMYCYANRQLKGRPMTLEQIKSIIRQARELGMLTLDINGGEVLFHPHRMEIFEELIQCGFDPLISTKIPVGKDTLLQLKSVGIHSIQLSFDSVRPATLHTLLGVNEDYFRKIDRMLHTLEEEGMRVTLHTVLAAPNTSVAEISDLLRYLESFSCIQEIRLSPAGFSLYRGEDASYMPAKKQLDEVFAYVEAYNRTRPEDRQVRLDAYYAKDYYRNKKVFQDRAVCTANVRSFVILPDGRVTICEELYEHPRFIIGDLTKQSILEMWNSPEAKRLFHLAQERISRESVCKSCAEFTQCRETRGVCWKEVLMAYGDEKWDFPDARCPKAPEMYRKMYTE